MCKLQSFLSIDEEEEVEEEKTKERKRSKVGNFFKAATKLFGMSCFGQTEEQLSVSAGSDGKSSYLFVARYVLPIML